MSYTTKQERLLSCLVEQTKIDIARSVNCLRYQIFASARHLSVNLYCLVEDVSKERKSPSLMGDMALIFQ